MAFRTLISTAALANHIADPGFTIVDCRFKLDDVNWGEAQWKLGHIPGAVYAHLDRDLSGPKTGTNGRHPLPAVATIAPGAEGARKPDHDGAQQAQHRRQQQEEHQHRRECPNGQRRDDDGTADQPEAQQRHSARRAHR